MVRLLCLTISISLLVIRFYYQSLGSMKDIFNVYNRDYLERGMKKEFFEDGKRYKESQKENGGIKESLNGEKKTIISSQHVLLL